MDVESKESDGSVGIPEKIPVLNPGDVLETDSTGSLYHTSDTGYVELVLKAEQDEGEPDYVTLTDSTRR
jgi:hypothetical protein